MSFLNNRHLGSVEEMRLQMLLGLSLVLLLSGCGHRKQTAEDLPYQEQAPAVAQRGYYDDDAQYNRRQQAERAPERQETPQSLRYSGRIPAATPEMGSVSEEDLRYVTSHRPIHSESGVATWYKAPYKGRKMANGQVFEDNAMVAAQRTLPMGSLIKVTNLATGQSAVLRVGDRGPFVEGRVVDLTPAAARATGIYWAGAAEVRVDVFQTPKPINSGGRWCVQIGALSSSDYAEKVKSRLQNKYPDAKVITFPGEKSFWVRIRPAGDNREQAESIARRLRLAEGTAFLTRLD